MSRLSREDLEASFLELYFQFHGSEFEAKEEVGKMPGIDLERFVDSLQLALGLPREGTRYAAAGPKENNNS